MLQSAIDSGAAHRRSVFELFPRRLPAGRRYGVVAGVGRALDAIESFRFTDTEIDLLREQRIVDEATLAYLADYRFRGDIWGYPEGETYFPYSPLLVVESTFAEAVLLETVLLSIYNHDSAIASAASRMTWAAGDRPCIEMGSRRTHEWAAVACARAAYVAGFTASSNLRARLEYGVPTAGTSAHSFTLLHDTEADAFRAQVHSLGKGTTLLVDTYDIAEAVRLGRRDRRPRAGRGPDRLRRPRACSPTGCAPSSTSSARPNTRIIVTSDLDEFAIAGLASAPVDGYGVGTELVTGSGHPDLRLRLQAGGPRGRQRRAGRRGEEEQGQDLGRRPQVRPAPPLPRRRRPGRGDRHRPARRRTTATTARCWCRSCARARSSGASRWRPPANGTCARAPSCPWSPASCPRASRSIETIHEHG